MFIVVHENKEITNSLGLKYETRFCKVK